MRHNCQWNHAKVQAESEENETVLKTCVSLVCLVLNCWPGGFKLMGLYGPKTEGRASIIMTLASPSDVGRVSRPSVSVRVYHSLQHYRTLHCKKQRKCTEC